jgi:hypothetical protein
LSLSAGAEEDEDGDEREDDVAAEEAYEEEDRSEDLPDDRGDVGRPEASQACGEEAPSSR